MNVSEWRDKVVACAAAQGERRQELRERFEQALAEFYWLMTEAPKAVHGAYRKIDETQLRDFAKARAAKLGDPRGALPWTPAADAETADVVLALAVEARAVDEALAGERGTDEQVVHPNEEWLAPGEPGTFVVPRRREPEDLACKTGDHYSIRGLRRHRVIPREIGGASIRFYAPALVGPGVNGEPAMLGAALFKKLELEGRWTRDRKAFQVLAMKETAKRKEDLLRHLELAHEGDGCLAVVWPELGGSAELDDFLARTLEDGGLGDGAAAGFLLSGSWHEPEGSGVVNVTRVLDGFGTELFRYRKMEPFWMGGAYEDIEPGTELPILVYGDLLIAFGICLDFCDLSAELPYHEMAVDLVLVPSFGNVKTIKSHIATAKVVQVRHRSQSFVVQQAFPRLSGEPRGPIPDKADPQAFLIVSGGGYVLPAPLDVVGATEKTCRERQVWRTHPLLKR